MNTNRKYAVILYGYMRTYLETSSFLIRNVLEINNADLFVYCYDNEGVSAIKDMRNINAEKKEKADGWDLDGELIDADRLLNCYGSYLKQFSINKYVKEKFVSDSAGVYSPILPIERCFSLYSNISNSVRMFNDYCKDNGVKYDGVLVTRPDLMFYEKIDFDSFDIEKVTVPSYGGNFCLGEKPKPYYACYYKNIIRGELIPWNEVIFSDQFIFSNQINISCLDSLYEKLHEYEQFGLPVCHPETVLYYHVAYSRAIQSSTTHITYEILRNNAVKVENEIVVAFPPEQIKNEPEESRPDAFTPQVTSEYHARFRKILKYFKGIAKAVLNRY